MRTEEGRALQAEGTASAKILECPELGDSEALGGGLSGCWEGDRDRTEPGEGIGSVPGRPYRQ